MNDKEIRSAIMNQDGNIVVSANAGSGKTSIMVNKIERELSNNKQHYTVAATTFTNKAAIEIHDRLKKMNIGSSINKCFIGTNDSFAMDEIIKPFLKDAFDLDNIIETDYSLKINNYDEGLLLIKDKSKLATYRNNNRNFKFELALKVLEKSLAARRYLKSKYFKIFIDEYQDCDIDMHNLYMYIYKSLKIDLFVVGDVKQSIYTWRGANPKFLNELKKKDEFKSFELHTNFRSNREIQNYTNLFLDENIDMYEIKDKTQSITFIDVNCREDIFNLLDKSKTISFLVKTNSEAETVCNYVNSLYNSPGDFVYIPKTPLSKISSSSSWIGELVAKIIFDKTYNEYSFKNDIPLDMDIKYLKTIITRIRKYENLENIIEVIIELYNNLNFELTNVEKRAIIDTIENNKYKIAYENIEFKHIVTTIHSSKGLEYDEVIIFANHYNLEKDEDIRNHYVAITRAKEKLVIFYDRGNVISNKYTNYLTSRIKNKQINDEQAGNFIQFYR